MALANALPDLRELPSQLRWDSDEEWWEYSSHILLTMGMLASATVAVTSMALVIGLGTTFAERILQFTMDIPFIGEAMLVPSLVLAGGVIAALVVLQLVPVTEGKEDIRDDANGIFLFNMVTYFAAAFNANLDISNSVKVVFVLFAVTFGGMYLVRVVMNRR